MFKKKYFYFLFFFNLTVFNFIKPATNNSSKKKILILSSRGGGAPVTASNSIIDILGKDYEITITYPITEWLTSLDFIKKFSFNKVNSEEFYNFLIRNNYYKFTNVLSGFGRYYIQTHPRRSMGAFEKNIIKENPDLVISVIPFIDGVTFEVCKKLNVPFLIVPTDFDVSNYVFDIKSPIFTPSTQIKEHFTYKHYDNFIFTLTFNDSLLIKNLSNLIPKDKIKFIGYPVRSMFLEKKDKKLLRKQQNLPEDKSVIMILMGSAGANSTYSFVKTLTKNKDLDFHLIICLGRNEKLRDKINKIKFPSNISMTIVSFTNNIADYMGAADLLITKSGPASIYEAIEMDLPMIIDYTKGILKWEQANIDIAKKYELAEIAESHTQLNNYVKKFINDKNYRDSFKKNFDKFKNKFKNELTGFNNELKKIVKELTNTKGKNAKSNQSKQLASIK